jgi:release factor glutamine methyltransferase
MYEEFRRVIEIFRDQGLADPLAEALHLADITSGGAVNSLERSLREQQHGDLVEVARRRKAGAPMEYILGAAAFAGLSLQCNEKTIVPTEYTRLLVDVAADLLEQRRPAAGEQTVIEVGTGCGNIAIAIAVKTEGVKVLATDVSPEALEVARNNLDTYKLNERITLLCGDLFSPFEGRGYEGNIDLIACNPPYIPTSFLKKLAPEVINYQPRVALDAGPYGIDFFQRLVGESAGMLKPGGALVFEIGDGQEKLVARILSRNDGYEDIRYFQDEDGITRVCRAIKRTA